MIATILPDEKPDGPESPAPPTDPTDERSVLIARIGDGIRAVAGQQRCSVARSLHRTGISMAHFQILWMLGEHGPLPVGRVADLMGVAIPNATGLIDRMEQRGLVVRERVAGDRRVVLVRVTDAGRDATEQVDGWRSAVFDRLFAGFERGELARLAEAIDEVRASSGRRADTGAAICAPDEGGLDGTSGPPVQDPPSGRHVRRDAASA